MTGDRLLAVVAGLFLAAAMLSVLATGLRVTFGWAGVAVAALPPVLLGAAGLLGRGVGRRGRLGSFAWHAGMLLAVLLAGSVASYAAAAASTGFMDPALAGWDRALGLDWFACYQFVAVHPAWQVGGRLAYRSIYVSPVLLLWVLAWTGRDEAARRFILGIALALGAAVAGSFLWPAMGTYASAAGGLPLPYRPITADEPRALITALRNGTAGIVDLGIDQGIICMPSFHTACALLYIRATWRIPRLRLAIVPLNLLMLAATPVEGSHYIVDILAGAALAVLAATGAAVLTARPKETVMRPGSTRHPAVARR